MEYILLALAIIIGTSALIFYYFYNNEVKKTNHNQYAPHNNKTKQYELSFSNNSNALPYCIIFDIETTGLIIDKDLKPTIKNLKDFPDNYPNIVQISWSVFSRERQIITEGDYYIKQNKEIPEKAIEIHNITNQICEEKGEELKTVLEKFKNDCDICGTIIAHNLKFDKSIIEAEFIRCNLKKPFTNKARYDTMLMGQSIMKQRKYPTLKELCIHLFGNNVESQLNSHNSLYDLFFTAHCFFFMKQMKGQHWNK
jgi:DNA polymerase III epsilon subunit-like protein